MTDAELALVNSDGLQIANYVNGGGGLYAQAESPLLGHGDRHRHREDQQ